jgi:hypothetical protein
MTKVATIDTRRCLCLVMVAAMVLTTLLAAMLPALVSAADNDDMGGSFTLGNSAPTIDQVLVVSHADNTTALTSITPQAEFIIKVQITDANTWADLTTCNVTIFYDSNDDDSSADIPAASATDAAKVVFDQGASTFTLTPGSTTWAMGTGSTYEFATVQQGWICFHIVPGKIARQTADNWDVYVSVLDDESTPGYDTAYSAKDLQMNFYGEVTTSDSVSFGSVTAGSTYAANKVTGKSVTYISNGAYDEQVAADSAWGTATLDATDSPGANEFCLKANDVDDDGTYVQVDTTASYTTIDVSGTITDEDGDTVATNTIWLRLGTPFASGTYTGTIYFKVINGT